MPLEPEDARHIAAAEGYAMLGMWLDAQTEHEAITADVRQLPEVLAVQIEIYRGLKNWNSMQVASWAMAVSYPDRAQWFISWAYATRRCDSIEAARLILLTALEKHPVEATLHYNLACYDCQLGALHAAKKRLKKVFVLAPVYRQIALEDKDLEPLWSSLSGWLSALANDPHP